MVLVGALIFKHNRLYVGRSLGCFRPVWYEPVPDSDSVKRDVHKIGLYWRNRGVAGDREPMYGRVAWGELWNPEHIHAPNKREKERLHEQLLHDVWNYITNRDDDQEPYLTSRINDSGTDGLYIAVMGAARAVREQKLKTRAATKRRRARLQKIPLDQANSDSSDSGFESGDDDAGPGGGPGGGDGGSRGSSIAAYDSRNRPGPGGGDGGSEGSSVAPYDRRNGPRPRPGDGGSTAGVQGSMGPPTKRIHNQRGKVAPRSSPFSTLRTPSVPSKRGFSEVSPDFIDQAIEGSSPPPRSAREASMGNVRPSVENGSEATSHSHRDVNGSADDYRRFREFNGSVQDSEALLREAIRQSMEPTSSRPTLGGELLPQSGIIDLDSEDSDDEARQGDSKPEPSGDSQCADKPDRSSSRGPLPTPGATQAQPPSISTMLGQAEAARNGRRSASVHRQTPSSGI